MSSNYKSIEVSVEKDIFFLALNCPENRNALDENMLVEIKSAVSKAELNDEIKVILIQGGEKIFASGADIKQLNERKTLDSLKPGMQGLYKKLEDCSKVTIAVIRGFALGGGCELALACDIRIVTENAKLGLPELNLGIIPGGGGTQRLSRIIGKGRALDMILTGKIIKGEEAERIGLASYFSKESELDSAINDVTDNISKKGPVALLLAKKAVHQGYDVDKETAFWIEKLSQAVAFGTEDKNEGTLAFLEKRQADFKNK